MKYAVKFPYSVFKNSLKIEAFHSDDFYEYKLTVPDVVFSEGGLSDINKTDLDLVAEVNCSSTMYRECFYSSDTKLETLIIKIPKKEVNHKFELDSLIVAKRAIGLKGQKIEKGMPLAHFGSNSVKLSRNQRGLIVFDKVEESVISYEFGSNLIKIKIPKKEYVELSRMKNRPEIQHLLASQFAQIALLEACKFLKEGDGKSHLNWHEELLKRWKKFNNEKEYPDSEDHLVFVNDILKNPGLTFARFLINEAKRNKDE